MCGIIGILACGQGSPSLDPSDRRRLRDAMVHRGPDDAGEWNDLHAWFGHRRLAIMDPNHGREPIVRIGRSDGRVGQTVVVFNGELLNHLELRAALEAEGERFETGCDAETAAAAVHLWGAQALDRFRGMFAIAWYRPDDRELHLARDPFGVIPLYWTVASGKSHEFVFASELKTLLQHPAVRRRVDPFTLSSYLSTIRVTLGERTMIDGLRTVRPGGLVRIRTGGSRPEITATRWWTPPRATGELTGEAAVECLHAAVSESLEAHLQSDVEVCGLLSGGIDSASLLSLARPRYGAFRTFTALGGDGEDDPDRAAADLMAGRLGTEHVEVPVLSASEPPTDRWRRMVRSLGMPLGTPNEIAINALAEAVRGAGVKVAIGGEGADELLGGYEPILRLVLAITKTDPGPEAAAAMLLESASWISPGRKSMFLREGWVEATQHDAVLIDETAAAIGCGGSSGDPRSYLHWLQMVNLPGLLGRLNAACMLASVEARPPFADRRVADAAARIATDDLFGWSGDGTDVLRTKTALRSGFRSSLPAAIIERPKASFPMPFVPWAASILEDTSVQAALEPLLDPMAMAAVLKDPGSHPLQVWPMANLGLWSVEAGVSLAPD
ncbi:MAG: asparagine synthase (glutamine-hydrolyzing) [Phycisphaerales bacterium]|nr:asparagine synthase (glutamine-hydrolyzing) [Phycisphaerales bacterium]